MGTRHAHRRRFGGVHVDVDAIAKAGLHIGADPLGGACTGGAFTCDNGDGGVPVADAGVDALGLDWTIDIGAARARVGDRVALQGNMDPAALFSPPAAIEREAKRILERFGKGPGHVFNLGHGVSQFTPPDHVHALVEAVRRHSPGTAGA